MKQNQYEAITLKLLSQIDFISRWVLKAPIYLYRYTLSSIMGRTCRHEPSCSLYAINAIDLNGAWKGFWLTLARVWRCGPGGSHGFDPAPDLSQISYPIWKAWAYGTWGKKLPSKAEDKET